MEMFDLSDGLWADEAWEDEGLDGEIQKAYAVFLDQTLDQPLLDTACLRFEKVLNSGTDRSGRLKENAGTKREQLMAEIVMREYNEGFKWKPYSVETMLNVLDHLMVSVETCREFPPLELAKNVCHPLESALGEIAPLAPLVPGSFSRRTADYYTAHKLIRRTVDKLRALAIDGDQKPTWFTLFQQRVLLSDSLFCCVWPETKEIWYGSYDMWLNIVDIFRIRFTACLAIDVLSKEGLTTDLLDKQFRWQEDVLDKYGNLGYELVKAPEALWKCWVSRLSGGSYSSPDAYDRMVEKQREKERLLSKGPTPLVDQFVAYQATVQSIENAVELFGVIKASGFPVIETHVGSASAREQATKDDHATSEAMMDSWRMVRHLFLVNYLKQHGSWPRITFTKPGTTLEKMYADNRLSIGDYSYPLRDWDGVNWDAVFDFDYHEDYLELMDDKACSPPRSMVKKFYQGDRSVERWWRRILQVMLKEKDVDTRGLIHQFASDTLSPEAFSILVRPKEKEFKLAARMYCMMTFSIRLIFSIIQENVKQQLFQYFPYQSMTMDSVELTHKLLAMTASGVDDQTLFIEVDLTRWNLCFRNNHLRGYGRFLDELFGVKNVFGRANETFWKCRIVNLTSDMRIEPLEQELRGEKVVDDDMSWSKHKGGFEGVDQATMTLATMVMIYRALRGEDCSFILLGQGDNQTLAITKRNKVEEMESFSRRVMSKIEKSCRQLNHIAKPEEFIDSTTVLTYSKVFIVRGRIIPMELKYSSGIAPITSSDLPAIGDALGAIFSAASGASQNAVNPLRMWVLALIVFEDTINRLQEDGAWLGRDRVTRSGITRLNAFGKKMAAIIPSVLGGFPLTGWTAFVARNEPDPLTAAIAGLRFVAPMDLDIQRALGYLLSDKPYRRGPIDLEKLIKDPYSLPFINPPTQRSTLQKVATSEVLATTKNGDIKQLMRAARTDGPKILTALKSMRPMFPALCHDLYELSVPGKCERVTEKFVMTRTITASARSRASGIDLKLIEAEIRSSSAVIDRFSAMKEHPPCIPNKDLLSYDIAEKLRCHWGLGPGVIQGVSTTHPLDYRILFTDEESYGVRSVCVSDYSEVQRVRGPIKPFLGAKTRERRTGKTYEVKKEPNTLELGKIVTMATSGGVGPMLRELISKVASTRTSIPMEALEEFFPRVIGGILAHRYEMLGAETAMAPVGNPNLQTHLVFNSDDVPGVSGSKVDYPVAFQQFFSYLTFFQRQVCLGPSQSTARTVVIQLSNRGLSPLVQEEISADELTVSSTPMNFRSNKLLWIDALKVQSKEGRLDKRFVRNLNIERVIGASADVRHCLITSLLIQECSKRAPTAIRLDSEELGGGRPPYKMDAVAFDALGLKAILHASVSAVAHLAIIGCLMELPALGEERKKSLMGLIEKWSDIVTDIWAPHLERKGANLAGPEDYVLVAQPPTTKRSKDPKVPVVRWIIGKAFSVIDNRLDDSLFIPLIGISRKPATAIGSVLSARLGIIVWRILQLGGRGYVAEIYQKIHKKSSRVARDLAPRDNLVLLYTDIIYEGLKDNLPPIFLDRLKALQRLRQTGYGVINIGSEEIWRALRGIQPEARVPLTREKFPYIDQSGTQSSKVSYQIIRGQMTQVLSDLLPRIAEDGDLKVMIQKAGRNAGLYSSAGAILQEPLSFIKTSPTLVLGTGAGGIQAELASRGLSSVGVDQQSILRYNSLGSLNYKPPEAARFGTCLAQYAAECELGEDDYLDPDSLRRICGKYNPKSIVIDVHLAEGRLGIGAIRSVIQSGFHGQVIFTFRGYKGEIESIIGSLEGSPGITNVACYMLDIGDIVDRQSCSVAICFKLKPGAILLSECNVRVRDLKGSRQCYPRSLIPEIEWEEQLNDLTGGFVRSVKGLDAKSRLLFEMLDSSTSVSRGRVSSSSYLAIAVSLALIRIMGRVIQEPSRVERLKIVATSLAGEEIVHVRGRKHKVNKANVGYSRGLLRHVARYINPGLCPEETKGIDLS